MNRVGEGKSKEKTSVFVPARTPTVMEMALVPRYPAGDWQLTTVSDIQVVVSAAVAAILNAGEYPLLPKAFPKIVTAMLPVLGKFNRLTLTAICSPSAGASNEKA
jgi:hypothetical protein